jgi:pimeloyl-ACP methyl ester carboxylesterase
MESGGDSTRGLGQSLCDLNDCITVLKADEHLGGCELSVMGHSWGAFSTMNICALHPEITRVVALSGFVSVEEMIGTLFFGLLKGYRAPILAVEREANARFCAFHAVSSLAKSKTRALLIYSDNDTMCRPLHYRRLREGLDGCEGIELLLVRHKGHNPNYTEAAVRYLGEFGRQRAKLLRRRSVSAQEKAAFVASFDWHRMTEQDEAVWERILAHLNS